MNTKENYHVGKWYSWTGGDCPVHPKTKVEIITQDRGSSGLSNPAEIFDWEADHNNPIVAFKVFKEEPEELYIMFDDSGEFVNIEKERYKLENQNGDYWMKRCTIKKFVEVAE